MIRECSFDVSRLDERIVGKCSSWENILLLQISPIETGYVAAVAAVLVCASVVLRDRPALVRPQDGA